jgi:hypothetical protein
MKTLIMIAALAMSLSMTTVASASSVSQSVSAGAGSIFSGNSRPELSVDIYTSKLALANAKRMAKQYIAYSAFSRSGLIEQLVYEGFSNSISTKAVDSLKLNWNKQAGKMAKSYLEYSAFSRDGLLEQLVYEGFSQSQAEAGLRAVGY